MWTVHGAFLQPAAININIYLAIPIIHPFPTVLCLSAHAFGSDWAQLESGTLRTGQRPFRDPLNKERRFLPLRLDDAPIVKPDVVSCRVALPDHLLEADGTKDTRVDWSIFRV